jgi:CRISPR-associated protein Cmr3
MNQLLLVPTDILFFRDGRPMGGSATGHGAAWPLPTVTNAALHAALWRSGLATQSHAHGRKQGREIGAAKERFGSLTTAGPFPVCTNGTASTWFFPRPLDADCKPELDTNGNQTGKGTTKLLAQPTAPLPGSASSNPLPYLVASTVPPTKDTLRPWWSEGAWNAYLDTNQRDDLAARLFTKGDADFSDSEAMIGIGIDPERGTQDGERFYSAHYLRLREGWNLGLLAETAEKFAEESLRGKRHDLVGELIKEDQVILVGGQQRLCTAKIQPQNGGRLPLPLGKSSGFATATLPDLPGLSTNQPKHLVKWVLLSPAIYPRIEAAASSGGEPIHPHSGGWLPSWIRDDASFAVQLRSPIEPRDVATESRDAYRRRVQAQPFIAARLIAALVGKPIPVTGWSLGTPDAGEETTQRSAGAKSTHLAVPAGAVYYFACDTAEAAAQLAAALNWHGDTTGTAIRNRRSTLLGEKGFGLGVCGTWQFYPPAPSDPSNPSV